MIERERPQTDKHTGRKTVGVKEGGRKGGGRERGREKGRGGARHRERERESPHTSSLRSLSPCDSRSQSLEFKQTVLRLKMIETNLQGDE